MAADKIPYFKLDPQEVYDFFDRRDPADLVKHVRRAVKLVEKKGEASFEEFNKMPSKWNPARILGAIFPMSCEEGGINGHPYSELQFLIPNKKLISAFKDVKGHLTLLELCNNLGDKEWAITKQTQHWATTAKPIEMIVFLIQVPKTKYQMIGFMPSQMSTEEFSAYLK